MFTIECLEGSAYYYLAQIALIKGENAKAVNYINLALEIDKTIEKKIEKHPLFLSIKDEIKIPNENRKIEMKLSEKEIKVNKYLEEMYELVDSLNSGNNIWNEEVENIIDNDNIEIEEAKERE